VNVLSITRGATTAHVAPDLGFNCYSLVVDGFDVLHQAPDLFDGGSPTRSGTPVLFPWPNRIAGSSFDWDGQGYSLPRNEAATGASLHGYACHHPWRVLATDSDRVTGEFLLSRDAPGAAWPADARLRVTYEVQPGSLIVTSEVHAPDHDLPFGLGFHPYLRVPGPFDEWRLQCDAAQAWPLQNMIPTGEVVAVPARLDFRTARGIGSDHLDDVLTGLSTADGMTARAVLAAARSVTISSDPAFRDYVLYTTPARDAVAIEPYTCPTDAVHLAQRGIDAGWRVLPAGQRQTFSWRIDVT